ncbi:PR domain zinc finger protein 2 [Cololabis saira]|uniref:PR domain zinc finger protein 2 n=1 Tax=Cololabis saira TaxID=129043 RepID=UPI002AD32C57|nr:PR domain zinc finger protein 2 [Cololabis saira]
MRVCAAEQKTDNNKEPPTFQQISRNERTLVSQTRTTQPPRQSCTHVQPKTARNPSSFNCQISKQEYSVNELSYKSMTSACPTAATSGTSKRSVKAPTSKPSRSISSPTITKSEAYCGPQQLFSPSPHSQSEIPTSSHLTFLFSADVSALEGNASAIPEEHRSPSPSASFSLRSTFTVSASSSSPSTLLPKVYHSTPLPNGSDSDSSLLSVQPQSSQLFAEPIPSSNLCEAPRGHLLSPQQSHHFKCDPESLLLENQLTHSLSAVSARSYPSLPSLEPILSRNSPVPSGVSPNSYHGSNLKHSNAASVTSTPEPVHHKSTLLNATQNPIKTAEEETLTTDSEDEISSDSLGLVLHEEDTSDEEAQMEGLLMRENFIEKEVTQNQSVGTGSKLFCDLDGFSPLGLDMETGHPESPEHVYCDRLNTCQSSVHALDPTATQKIMDICNENQTGCEEPDVDTDTTAHILDSLEKERRVITKGGQVLDMGDGETQKQHERPLFM